MEGCPGGCGKGGLGIVIADREERMRGMARRRRRRHLSVNNDERMGSMIEYAIDGGFHGDARWQSREHAMASVV